MNKTLRPLLIIVIFIILAASLLRYEQKRQLKRDAAAIDDSPEFFLEGSLLTQFTKPGQKKKSYYQFNSEYLEYFKSSDNTIAKLPYFIFYNADGHTWHTRADQATFLAGNKGIQLEGNVRCWQPERHLELTTQELYISSSQEYAETKKPVHIKSIAGTTESIGLKLDLKMEKLSLLSTVRGRYETHN